MKSKSQEKQGNFYIKIDKIRIYVYMYICIFNINNL